MRMRSQRSALSTLLLVLGIVPGFAVWSCGAGSALAQSCHGSLLPADQPFAFRASLGSTFGSYDNQLGAGTYQGIIAGLAYAHPWVYAELSAPGYRLDDGSEARYGMGDLATDLRGTLYRSADARLAAGLGLAVTYPTGDSDHGFGMGHVMLMPGGWLSFQQDAVLLLLQLNYGTSVGASGGHGGHGHGSTSIVQPMNASEMEHALGISYRFDPRLRALARLFGALPVADRTGEAREIVAFALELLADRFTVSAEVQLPIVGDPFQARTLVSLGASW